jgi:hypothetical protein
VPDLEPLEQDVERLLRVLRLVGRHLERELEEATCVGQRPLLDGELVREGRGREVPLARLNRAEHREVVQRRAVGQRVGDDGLLRLAEQLAQRERPAPGLLDLAAIALPVELGRRDPPRADDVELDPDSVGRGPTGRDDGQRQRPQLDRAVVVVALRRPAAQHDVLREQGELRRVIEVDPAPRRREARPAQRRLHLRLLGGQDGDLELEPPDHRVELAQACRLEVGGHIQLRSRDHAMEDRSSLKRRRAPAQIHLDRVSGRVLSALVRASGVRGGRPPPVVRGRVARTR